MVSNQSAQNFPTTQRGKQLPANEAFRVLAQTTSELSKIRAERKILTPSSSSLPAALRRAASNSKSFPNNPAGNEDIGFHRRQLQNSSRKMAKRKILTSSSSSLPAGFGSAASNSKSFLDNPAAPKTDKNQTSLQKFLKTKCKSGTVTLDEAFRVFDYMMRIKPTPPVSAFNVLLAALAKVRHYNHVISFYKRFDSIGVSPNFRTLNILINCCCSTAGVCDGYAALGRILRDGYRPDTVTFNTLVRGLCRSEKIGEAIRLLRKMVLFGCQPDVITYGTLIVRLCKDGMLEEAKELFLEMKDRGLSPDVVVYSSLLHGFCGMGYLEEAKELLSEIVDGQMKPNVESFNVLIGALCQEGRIEEAMRLLDWTIQSGLCPNSVTYNTLIIALCRERRLDEAKGVVDLMIQRNQYPNTFTSNILINAVSEGSRLEEAKGLLDLMIQRSHPSSTVTYHSFIDALCKERGLEEEASDAVEKEHKEE